VAQDDWDALMELLDGRPEQAPSRAAVDEALAKVPGAVAVVRVPTRPGKEPHAFLLVSDDRVPGQMTVAVADAQVPGAGGLNGGDPQPVHDELWGPDAQVAVFDGDGKPTTLAALLDSGAQPAAAPVPRIPVVAGSWEDAVEGELPRPPGQPPAPPRS
jgi:hypothetical protein